VNDADIKTLLDARISRARAKELLIALVKVPSPQTELLEDEPLLKAFMTSAIEPRLRTMGFTDIRYDPMGNRQLRRGDEQQVADVHRQCHEPARLQHAQSLCRRRGRRREIRAARRMRDGEGRQIWRPCCTPWKP
jgi:hypothetical protein